MANGQPIERGASLITDSTLRAMVQEVEQCAAVFRPSNFWADLNAKNMGMLNDLGLENFKRTVAQNYYNWLVLKPRDNQFRKVFGQWLRHPTLSPFRVRMAAPDLLRTTVGLEDTIGWKELCVYRFFVAMLWDYAHQTDWAGLTRTLEEPSLGNPISIRLGNRLISQDLANSIREYNSILFFDRKTNTGIRRVAELGAGYGRLAYVFLSDEKTQYFIVDIPPALHVSQWYLTRLFPGKRAFRFRHFESFDQVRKEFLSSDVAFLTPNQLDLLPDDFFDIFLSISTLPEMRVEQIAHFLEQMQRKSSTYIYLKQWISWRNSLDGHEFGAERYSLGSNWRLVMDRVDAIQSLFFERLWRKSAS